MEFDELTKEILKIIDSLKELHPITITIVEDELKRKEFKLKMSRAMIKYRLNNLLISREINGEIIGARRGTWVYWKKRKRVIKNKDNWKIYDKKIKEWILERYRENYSG